MFFESKRFCNAFYLHSIVSELSHLSHYVLCKNGFVMLLAMRFPSFVNAILMVVFGSHPFKVFNIVIKFVEVFVVDCPARYADWAGGFADKCKSNNVVNSRHPFKASGLHQNDVVALDKHVCHYAAAHFPAIFSKARNAANKTRIADFVTSRKRETGYSFPLGICHV